MRNGGVWNARSRRGVVKAGGVVLAAAALVGTVGSPASAAQKGIDPAERRAGLRAVVEGGEASWSLGRIVEDGRTSWKGSAGVADRRGGAPADPDGRFRIGSITKTFTATVVLQLVGEGRIGLEDPVETHLPGVVPDGERITVRQLLNHTSGLFNYTDAPEHNMPVEEWVRAGRWQSYSAAGIVADAVGRAPYFPPGKGWKYSNTNYLLAGMLIERVTGRSWNKEVERRIARPLKLRDTTMPGTSVRIGGTHARNYTKLAGGPVDTTLLNPSEAGAGGAGVSTTADLARFHSALFKGELLRPAELREMKRTVKTDQGVRYGLGVQRLDNLNSLGCGEVWGHAGGIHGSVAFFFGDARGERQAVTSASLYGKPDLGALVGRMNKAVACSAS
ncbi:serine hydrolase domain-containing protein [Streptomyces amakusaensis]|uniref:Serine hydrolase domain-containing protein n=1 Tax=Streptomyces amakusaensis TaxID=67271 RepID=A0ABW0AJ51_9ACTN